MTAFERNVIERNCFELSEAIEADIILAREADYVCKVDARINQRLAELKLDAIEERRRWIKMQVKRRIG